MIKKFFPWDKNYLLEQVQNKLEFELLSKTITLAMKRFESNINPLGLVDSFALKIRQYKISNVDLLHSFYERAAAIYRFKYGDNQLEFLWDGSDHFQYYQVAWQETFDSWVDDFCHSELFIQAVLDLTVFLPPDDTSLMAQNRMNHFIEKYFDIKLHPSKGIIPIKAGKRKNTSQQVIGRFA